MNEMFQSSNPRRLGKIAGERYILTEHRDYVCATLFKCWCAGRAKHETMGLEFDRLLLLVVDANCKTVCQALGTGGCWPASVSTVLFYSLSWYCWSEHVQHKSAQALTTTRQNADCLNLKYVAPLLFSICQCSTLSF